MVQQSDPLSLRLGYWVAVHSAQLRTWWSISIIAIDFALIAIFAVTFTNYSFTTLKSVRGIAAMAQPLVGPELRQHLQPTDLETGDAVALPRGTNRYDLVVPVTNVNPQWAAVTVKYNFTFGTDTREETATLWPGQQAFLTQLNIAGPDSSSISKVTAHIVNVSWQRPDSLAIFKDITFPVSKESLTPVTGLSSGGSATRYSATVKNNSVYGLKNVRFGIVLKNGTTIVAANEVIVPLLGSFEERTIEATWLSGLPLSATATVFPIINLLDSQSFVGAR